MNLSIRKRLIAGLLLMMVPVFLLGAGVYSSLERVINSLDGAVDETFDRFMPLMRIERLMSESATPVKDYLVNGDVGEII